MPLSSEVIRAMFPNVDDDEKIKAFNEAYDALEKANAKVAAREARADGKAVWYCVYTFSEVEKYRQTGMTTLRGVMKMYWAQKGQLADFDEVTDAEGAMAEAIKSFVGYGNYEEGNHSSDSYVISANAPTLPFESVRFDLEYVCATYPCNPLEVTSFGRKILARSLEIAAGRASPTKEYDFIAPPKEPTYSTGKAGFRYQVFSSPVPSVSVVSAAFAGAQIKK